MKRLLTATAIALGLLTSAANAAEPSTETKAATVAVARTYEGLCATELPKAVRIVAEHHAKTVDAKAVEKKLKEVMGIIGSEGVGSWCRRMTGVFKKHNLAE